MRKTLSFTDRWMFNRVMCEEDICREVLRGILNIDIDHIEYLNAEQAKEPTFSGKGVRMDVFARESTRVFDIEVQIAKECSLGKRMRYYQAAIDTAELGAGADYNALPESYIIFVCSADAFGGGIPVYTFERMCLEKPGLSAKDASHWMVLNSIEWKALPSGPLRDFLHYVKTGLPDGRISREIDSRVQEYNQDREWVARVLTFEQDKIIQCNRAREEGREEGRSEGLAEGRAEGIADSMALINRLLAEGRVEDAVRATSDTIYRDSLLAKMEQGAL